MQGISRNRPHTLKGSAMPTAVTFSILMLLVGMTAIMALGFSLERIRHLEDKEKSEASFYAMGLRIMSDSTIVVDDMFRDYKAFPDGGEIVLARETMHGLYGLLEMRYHLSAGKPETTAKITGTKGLPYRTSLLIPSSDVGYVSLGEDCMLSGQVMLPKGVYRKIHASKSRNCLNDIQVSSSPDALPEFSSKAIASIKDIYGMPPETEVTLTSNDTVPDRIITGRVIRVDSSFCNSAQLFATDSVIVSSGAILKYPSGIFLNSSEGHILIDSCAVVEGYAIVKDTDVTSGTGADKGINFHLSSTGRVRGLVYVDGIAQIGGHVTGAVYVREPVEQTDKGISVMTILSLTQTENSGYAYPLIFEEGLNRSIIKEYETIF